MDSWPAWYHPAHRSYNFQDMRSTYPNDNCTMANYYYRYDTYTGTSDYSQVSISRRALLPALLPAPLHPCTLHTCAWLAGLRFAS
jgi:hypothetical protein